MSYCRWSSMDWQCDVYVYEHVAGGWMTHVAGRRRDGVMKNPFPMKKGYINRYMVAHQVQLDQMEECPWIDLSTIGEEAGQTYTDDTPDECADRLQALKDKGFNVPTSAIEALREEAAECTS